MPFCKRDIEQAAAGMIARYGRMAEQEAETFAATARNKGFNVTAVEWERIRHAVENLRNSKMEPG